MGENVGLFLSAAESLNLDLPSDPFKPQELVRATDMPAVVEYLLAFAKHMAQTNDGVPKVVPVMPSEDAFSESQLAASVTHLKKREAAAVMNATLRFKPNKKNTQQEEDDKASETLTLDDDDDDDDDDNNNNEASPSGEHTATAKAIFQAMDHGEALAPTSNEFEDKFSFAYKVDGMMINVMEKSVADEYDAIIEAALANPVLEESDLPDETEHVAHDIDANVLSHLQAAQNE